MGSQTTIKEFIEAAAPEDIKPVLLSAICTRGANKGFLLSNPPKSETGQGAWNAFISVLAPARVQISVLLFGGEARAAHDACDSWVTEHRRVWDILERPMRFNLWGLNHETETGRKLIREYCDNHEAGEGLVEYINRTNEERGAS